MIVQMSIQVLAEQKTVLLQFFRRIRHWIFFPSSWANDLSIQPSYFPRVIPRIEFSELINESLCLDL